jgi:hypothetical protein
LALLTGILILSTAAQAGTELDFWHSYNHQPGGIKHYSFHLANYKRGIFFGSCGVSTRSLQWAYEVDLAGTGPYYTADQVTLTMEGRKVLVASGTIVLDDRHQQATINLKVLRQGTNQTAVATDFLGNGAHTIHALQ